MASSEQTHQMLGAAYKVHSRLGPGLLESAYEACFAYELRKLGFEVATQVPLPITYDGILIEVGYRIDVIVNKEIIVELKSVSELSPLHDAQLLSYMKLSDKKLGYLINFNVVSLRDGIKRFVL